MKAAFHSGASGLMAQQQAMNTIGNNMANANTVGFQPSDISFSSLLSTNMYANTPNNPNTGHGVKAVNAGIRIGSGSLRQTGYNLDFAVMDDGFFAVESGGQIQYTRDGAFQPMMDGNSTYLGTQDGRYVLDNNENRIRIDKEEDEENFNFTKLKEEIGVYQFENPTALTPSSGNSYLPTAQSGEARSMDEENRTIMQGSLEGSGVSLADEMAELIVVQRSFQMSARVIQVADENEQTINSLRR